MFAGCTSSTLHGSRRRLRPWSTAHAMAEKSEKKAESAETYKMTGVQLAGAKPESRGTSPGDPTRAPYGRWTVPTR